MKKEEELLRDIQPIAESWARRALEKALINGLVSPKHFASVVEFGSGGGGSSLALKSYVERYNGRMETVELNPDKVEIAISWEILPFDQIHCTDGIWWIQHRAEVQKSRFTMIASFMFGPDRDGSLFASLVDTAKNALADDGVLLITSTSETLKAIEERCKKKDILPSITQTIASPEESFGPGMVVINEKELRYVLYLPKSSDNPPDQR